MPSLCPSVCLAHEREVSVSYVYFDEESGTHFFAVSSLSRPGLTHRVRVQLSHVFNDRSINSVQELFDKKLIRAWSSDEFYKYHCAYENTMNSTALYPEFRPCTKNEPYLCSHTLLAVLETIVGMGPGTLEDSFKSVNLRWNEQAHKYEKLSF